MHSRKGQKVSSFLGDKLLISSVQGTLEIPVQWNLVNTVTNRSKTFGLITWQVQIDDLRAVMTNTPYTAFAFLELFSLINNRNVDIVFCN